MRNGASRSRDDRRLPSRRRASIALWRAVETNQARGLAGVPCAGQRSRARAKASCTASSAAAMSPTRRRTVASTRPNSLRSKCSTAVLSMRVLKPPPLLPVPATGEDRGGGRSGTDTPFSEQTRRHHGCTTIIHGTPKRSATMPKHGEKNVLPSGMRTSPPSPSALNIFFASASFAA